MAAITNPVIRHKIFMPLHDTDAFVLRTFTLKEADKVCVFFTRESGKVRGVAYGARKLRSRFGASLEPFTEVLLTYFEKENRDLVSVSSCEIIRSQFVAGLSSERMGMMEYWGELVDSFMPDQEPNETVYRLIGAALAALKTADNSNLMILARYFEFWMLKLGGFFPDWRHCGMCEKDLSIEPAVYLTSEGQPQCAACSLQRGDELPHIFWRTIQEILTQAPAKFLSLPRDARMIAHLGGIATRLIARALEREPRSYEVLSRLRPAEVITSV
ncbi:MAG TPA: DNA repair protein RecO [Blastocatellia bacterium]|nr:DNA repair protein RecO [Blastocatellia bacterium]HMV81558.1 DNA repair protein RecO [Blastocatellia bacterium]HMY75306.1 DNA repair protein RecO [Blastocatellia bacterium]HMZ21192.1 DNA repair protein RecO [Blastocatellia bacterium]HNG28511.1 DNA repair protein RecO [Blastocatellia bacterium]